MVDILLYALLAGSLLAAATGPLGSLLTWQRMAYYGDTLAHSALLGAALGLALHTDVEWSVLVVCAGVASTPAMGSDWNVMPCVMPRPVSSDR